MHLKRQYWRALFLFMAIFSLLFLSGGLSNTEMSTEWNLFTLDDDDDRREGIASAADLRDRFPTIPDAVVQILFLTGVLIIPLLLIFAIFSAETRQAVIDELKRAVPFVIWILTIAYIMRRLQLRNTAVSGGPAARQTAPAWITDPPLLVTLSIGFIFIGTLVTLAWFLWKRLRPHHPLADIAVEAQATLEALEAGGNFTNTIIECYARMCHIIRREHHITRDQGMTPREFAASLEKYGVADTYARQLTHLFEKVRYGAEEPTTKDRREAVACLEAIVYTIKSPRQPTAAASAAGVKGHHP